MWSGGVSGTELAGGGRNGHSHHDISQWSRGGLVGSNAVRNVHVWVRRTCHL